MVSTVPIGLAANDFPAAPFILSLPMPMCMVLSFLWYDHPAIHQFHRPRWNPVDKSKCNFCEQLRGKDEMSAAVCSIVPKKEIMKAMYKVRGDFKLGRKKINFHVFYSKHFQDQ